jgi:putative restriction endonuclease
METDHIFARDAAIRQAAFDHVRALQNRDLVLTHTAIAQGFMFEGKRWPLWNPQRGIFKPRGIPFLLTSGRCSRARVHEWYDDQLNVHRPIFAGEEELDCAFMGTDPSAPDNVWLREAAERSIPNRRKAAGSCGDHVSWSRC